MTIDTFVGIATIQELELLIFESSWDTNREISEIRIRAFSSLSKGYDKNADLIPRHCPVSECASVYLKRHDPPDYFFTQVL